MSRFNKKWMMATCLFLTGLFYQQGHAATDTIVWSDPVVISSAGPVSSPQIVGDAAGNAVVIWVDNTSRLVFSAFLPAGSTTWGSPSNVSGATQPQFAPSIAINNVGQGVIAYDNGSSALYIKTVSIANGAITFGTPLSVLAREPRTSSVASMDDSGNAYLAWQDSDGMNYSRAAWPLTSWTGGNISGNIYVPSAFNLAVDSSGVGYVVWDEGTGNGVSEAINGISSLGPKTTIVSGIYNGGRTEGVLAGIGHLGNATAIENISPYTWQVFFSPMNSNAWEPASLTLSNVSVLPALNVNSNGLGVLAYNLTTDSNVHSRFLHLPNQTVGRDLVVGQGTNPAIDTDSFGDAFAAWIGPQGYLNGSWLPVGSSTWKASTKVSSHLVASGTTPAMTMLALGGGAVVYAVADGVRCVFFELEDPAVIKKGVLINTLKYNDDRRQKGIQ